jgi:hypothetical protein
MPGLFALWISVFNGCDAITAMASTGYIVCMCCSCIASCAAGEGHTASSAASRQCRLVFRKELPLQRRIRTSDTDSCWQTQESGVLKCKEFPGKQGASNGLSLRCVSSSILDGSKREKKGRRHEEARGAQWRGRRYRIRVSFTCFCYLGG